MDVGGLCVVAGVAAVAGLVQGVTGFGAGIVVMTVLPMLLGVARGSAVSVAAAIAFDGAMAWHYRDSLRIREAAAPAALFVAVSAVCIAFAKVADPTLMKGALGVFLMLLSVYFLVLRRDEPTHGMGRLASIGCVAVSGACDGLFGIGGPLMVVYYLARIGDKRAYLGTLQLFFLVTALFGTGMRVVAGILTADLLGVVALVALALVAGQQVAHRVVERLDAALLRRVTYVLIGASGAYYVVQAVVTLALA